MREVARRNHWKLFLLAGCWLVTSNIGFAQSTSTTAEDQLKVSARYHIESGSNKGFLIVKIHVPDGSYIYSTTQAKPLLPSRLKVAGNKQFVADKKFSPDKQPKVIEHDPLFKTRVEKHFGTVQFYVPIKVDPNANLEKLQPEIQYFGQVCSDQGFCKQIDGLKAQAKFSGYYQPSTERTARLQLPFMKEK